VRIALFITCFNDTLFPQTGKAVVTRVEGVHGPRTLEVVIATPG
jgi:hypothetical protein